MADTMRQWDPAQKVYNHHKEQQKQKCGRILDYSSHSLVIRILIVDNLALALVRTWVSVLHAWNIVWSVCASRHLYILFFDISLKLLFTKACDWLKTFPTIGNMISRTR